MINFRLTSQAVLVIFVFLLSVPLGLATYTFYYAEGHSYFSNNSRACINCHVMQDQYSAWVKGSHHSVATCNDCHTPSGLVKKYLSKASNGFWHSFAFTTGNFIEPIQIKPHNRQITEDSCKTCHSNLIESSNRHSSLSGLNNNSCMHCHSRVGHDLRK